MILLLDKNFSKNVLLPLKPEVSPSSLSNNDYYVRTVQRVSKKEVTEYRHVIVHYILTVQT
jgi:hypothetical protein